MICPHCVGSAAVAIAAAGPGIWWLWRKAMTLCNVFVGDTTHGCSLEAGHASRDHVAFVNGREVARATHFEGQFLGVKTYVPVPIAERVDHVKVHPPGQMLKTLHQRRFQGFKDGRPLPGSNIASRSLAWAIDVAREQGADEIRLMREYHNA